MSMHFLFKKEIKTLSPRKKSNYNNNNNNNKDFFIAKKTSNIFDTIARKKTTMGH